MRLPKFYLLLVLFLLGSAGCDVSEPQPNNGTAIYPTSGPRQTKVLLVGGPFDSTGGLVVYFDSIPAWTKFISTDTVLFYAPFYDTAVRMVELGTYRLNLKQGSALRQLDLHFTIDSSIVFHGIASDSGYPGSLVQVSTTPGRVDQVQVYFGEDESRSSQFYEHWWVPAQAASGPMTIRHKGNVYESERPFKVLKHNSNLSYSSMSIRLEGLIGEVGFLEMWKTDTVWKVDTLPTIKTHIFRHAGFGRPNSGDSVIVDLDFAGHPGCNCGAQIASNGFVTLDTITGSISEFAVTYDSVRTSGRIEETTGWSWKVSDLKYTMEGTSLRVELTGEEMRRALAGFEFRSSLGTPGFGGTNYTVGKRIQNVTSGAKLIIVLHQ